MAALPDIFGTPLVSGSRRGDSPLPPPAAQLPDGSAVPYASERAPVGGVTVQGTFYPGGRFIPSEVVAGATDEEKKAIASGEARGKPLPPDEGVKVPTQTPKEETPPITFVPHPNQRPDETTVMVDPAKLDAEWQRQGDVEYIPPGGGGAEIGGRRANFGEFLKKGKPIEASRVAFDVDGNPSFIDGRHRFSVLRDMGVPAVAVTVAREDAQKFIDRYGVSR